MDCFKADIKLIYKGEEYSLCCDNDVFFSEKDLNNAEYQTRLEWDTLITLKNKYRIFGFDIDTCLFSSKRLLKIFLPWNTLKFSERKYPDLETANILFKITYKRYNPSIKEVMENRNGRDAIKYLAERGMNTIYR